MGTSKEVQPGSPDRTDGRTRVAIDVGPLHGHRTGVGQAVAWTIDALRSVDLVDLDPYLTSLRATPSPGVRKLPLPAAVAHRLWQRASPPLDLVLGRPDVVHGTNYVVPPTVCPRVVSVYDCWFLDHPEDVSPDVQRSARVLRRSIAHGAMVVTCSDATSERVRELLGTDRVRTVLLGPPPSSSSPSSPAPGANMAGDGQTRERTASKLDAILDPAAGPMVLALGTVERRKNIPNLVRAFDRVAREHPTARLVVAGAPGNDHDAVLRAVAGLSPGAASRTSLLGPVDEVTKQELLDKAAALAYPSLDEGFGFPLLEAQQADLPVVASTAGSIPEVAGSAALYSSPFDVDALAANLHLAITSEQVRTKLIAQGRRNLERFSWTTTATSLSQIYLDLANGGAP
jgi:glycosyltransferase involved in cell wall biosynthesis